MSEAERDNSYLHLVISSDPFQILDHYFAEPFSEFVSVMASEPLPFDNFYTSQDGMVARQARSNRRQHRLFTWEFSRRVNSFVTVPIPNLVVPSVNSDEASTDFGPWTDYEYGKSFAVFLAERNLSSTRVLNLNLLISILAGVIARHRTLAGRAGVKGPFFIKATIDNVWRAVPFIDTAEYMDHLETFDVPVVQDSDLTAPPGRWPEGFISAPELDHVPKEDESSLNDTAFTVWVAIMQALGIPGEVLVKNPSTVLAIASREALLHRTRAGD